MIWVMFSCEGDETAQRNNGMANPNVWLYLVKQQAILFSTSISQPGSHFYVGQCPLLNQ